jgi:hypothetical protein
MQGQVYGAPSTRWVEEMNTVEVVAVSMLLFLLRDVIHVAGKIRI